MTKFPIALIFLRLVLGLVILFLSIIHVTHYKAIAIILLSLGLLTDIFDGIIARHLKVSTERLRRLDSGIDQLFFILVAIATYIDCPAFFSLEITRLVVLISLEVLIYVVSYFRFKKEVATHSLGAKIWTLTLVATLIEIMAHCQSPILFSICFWLGVVTRFEIVAILFVLRKWTNDVPTFYHALQLRNGKEIKRHKMFNG